MKVEKQPVLPGYGGSSGFPEWERRVPCGQGLSFTNDIIIVVVVIAIIINIIDEFSAEECFVGTCPQQVS